MNAIKLLVTWVFLNLHFQFWRDVIIYHVYVSNDFLIGFFIAVAAMDTNVEILIELAQLRGLSIAFSGGDRIRRSLASTLDAIVETITLSSNILYDITSYRERKRREYADGLSYSAIKKLKITKEHIFSLFRDPRTGEIPNENMSHISIEWCTYQPFVDN